LSPSASTAVFTSKPPTLLLVRLTAMAVVAPLLVRAGLPRLQRWLEPSPSRGAAVPTDIEFVGDQYGRWVDSIVARGQPVVRPGCLTRGVTLYYALRRRGVDVALCFGVGPHEGEMAGHCWLDLAGQPFLEPADPLSKFTEVVRLSRIGVTH
jgi:Transglutaminase-like superfamily